MKSKKRKKKLYFLPRVKIKFNIKFKIHVLNAILKSGFNYISIINDDYFIEIEIYSHKYKFFSGLFESLGIDYEVGTEYGILSVFKKNKKRVGMLLGIVFLILIANLSSRFVWKINVNGNSKLTNEEILKIADEAGLRLGTYIPAIDYDRLHNQILLSSDKISWISVNITGNVANIELKETEEIKNTGEVLYTNIVSKFDGQIISIEAINGEKKIKPGDIVKKGELLISGIIDSHASGVRYENAKGSVYAYVNKKITVEIPRKNYENIAVKKLHTDRSIKIFSNIIKISLNHSNCGEFCGKIEKKEAFILFGMHELPITIHKTEHFLVETQEKIYENQEMVDLAFAELNEKMSKELENAQIVSKSVKTYYQNDTFILECDLYCVEDIAKEVEYFVEK